MAIWPGGLKITCMYGKPAKMLGKSVDHDNVKGFGGRETRSEERVINNDQ